MSDFLPLDDVALPQLSTTWFADKVEMPKVDPATQGTKTPSAPEEDYVLQEGLNLLKGIAIFQAKRT